MKNLIRTCLGFFFILCSQTARASRMAPVTIDPIITKRGVIHHSLERSDDGYSYFIFMKDKAGDLRWKTLIFRHKYMKNLETDVQDIHLRHLSLEDYHVVATDEKGNSYKLERNDGSLIAPLRPNDYSVVAP